MRGGARSSPAGLTALTPTALAPTAALTALTPTALVAALTAVVRWWRWWRLVFVAPVPVADADAGNDDSEYGTAMLNAHSPLASNRLNDGPNSDPVLSESNRPEPSANGKPVQKNKQMYSLLLGS